MLHTMFQEKKDGRLGKVINLRNELDEFMEYIGLSEKMQDMKILKVWNECVGDTISQFSKPRHKKEQAVRQCGKCSMEI